MASKQQQIKNAHSYNYLLFVPEVKEQPLPTIIFLHGAGECGDNLEDVKRHGVAKIVEEQAEFPFIAISPQCPLGEHWLVEKLSLLLDEAIATYPIDQNRIYLTGLSMGGYGTWYWGAAEPERFAAIAPICGGGNLAEAYKLKNLPIWAFHGAKDNVIPLSASKRIVSFVEASGGNVKFTIYPEAGHDSWTQTYNNPQLYKWFLQHRRQ